MEENIKKRLGVSEQSIPIREDMVGTIGYSSNERSYLDYISRVYGNEDVSVNFFESLLLHNGVNYISNYKDTSVIHTPKVAEALSGEITTNPNAIGVKYSSSVYDPYLNWGFDGSYIDNLKKSDTRIGIIGNTMYSNSLYKQAVDGSARGRNLYQGLTGQSPYITPYLFYEYGDNLSTIEHLGDIMPVDPIRGIAVNNFDDNVRITYYEDVNRADNGNYDFLQTQFGRYLQEKGKYLEGSPEIGWTTNGTNTQFFSNLNYKISNTDRTTISGDKTEHLVYDDGVTLYGTEDEEFDDFYTINNADTYNDIVGKTQKLFRNRKLKSLMGGFYMGIENTSDSKEIDSVLDSKYGHSRGRNLFNYNQREVDRHGFKDPYCRSWTYHHQYDRLSRAIRPFVDGDDNFKTLEDIQSKFKNYRSYVSEDKGVEYGGTYLAKYSVLRDNGFIKIGMFDHDLDEDVDFSKRTDIHRYMLSIENLAWRDFQGDIERNRKGPNGGRIMWFPPYGLDFQESVDVQWNENSFIGRGEKMYTYTNTTRSAQLSFIILIDHPAIANDMAKHAGNIINTISPRQAYDSETQSFYEEHTRDADGDILRYFAGCDSFEFVPQNQADKEDKSQNEQIDGNIEQQPSSGIEDQFAVFFPNNYSGKYEFGTSQHYDGDLGQYLIYGKNINVNSGTSVGYEINMGQSTGISNPSDSNTKGEYIQACQDPTGVDIKKACQNESTDPSKRFLYRVDFNLRQDFLNVGGGETSYQDRKSLGLNSSLSVIQQHTNGHFKNNTCTFLDFMYAYAKYIKPTMFGAEKIIAKGENLVDEEKVNEIVKKIQEYGIKEIIVQGGATQQDPVNSAGLAQQRGINIGNYLKNLIGNDVKVTSLDIFKFKSATENIEKVRSVDTDKAKYQRCAQVKIVYGTEDISTVGNLNEKNQNYETQNLFANTDSDNNNIQSSLSQDVVIESGYGKDYEYEYFKELIHTDPFVFKAIKQKFNYFDPAYHSLSPEGFNARLNFLHQCTRQGHTVSASDPSGVQKAVTAGNLAFGRMPVCVLRIGDFINSRAIIQSMSLQYSNDGIQWDLNPEGIGVQPMFAQVSLNVVLLGGSALNYPINRLQNAQTFDYYANTGVYDSRADRISINETNGELTPVYNHIYSPQYKYTLKEDK